MSRKQTKLLTKQKRKSQSCKVYELKIDKSKFSNITDKHLKLLFLEAKWFFNDILSRTSNKSFKAIQNCDTKSDLVIVVCPDDIETRELKVLTAQMKQDIKDRIVSNIKTLSTLKKKGKKVGKITYKSYYNSIPLRQHKITYTINRENNYIKIQGLKQKLQVHGLDQLPEECEIANATLINRNNDYYLNITTYVPRITKIIPDLSIGIDFGCESQLTLSNGIKIKYEVPISKKLKRLDRKIMKKNRKHSNNKYKDQIKRRKEYERLSNIKGDTKNKIVNILVSNYKTICFQDENLNGWKHRYQERNYRILQLVG